MEKVMRVKKRNFTLLETLLALMLTSLIFGTTLVLFHQVNTTNQKFDKIAKESFKMRYIENRLMRVFSQAQPFKEQQSIPSLTRAYSKKKPEDLFFFTSNNHNPTLFGKSDSLVFTYDNGMKLDKEFSNQVLGRLYLDEKGQLCLLTWPAPSRWNPIALPPAKKEVLMDGIDSMEFSFYAAPDRPWKIVKNPKLLITTEMKPIEGWQAAWNQEFQELPSLIRITVKLKGEKEHKMFAVPILQSNRQIVYKNVEIKTSGLEKGESQKRPGAKRKN